MLDSKAKWCFVEQLEDQDNDPDHSGTPIVSRLLMQRGIDNQTDQAKFLSPSLEDLLNPSGLSMIHLASERIHHAIENQERILIYGDYDADGVTSTALLLKVLNELGAICDFYIPNRFTEGYGPNEMAFRQAHEKGIQLIITVDSGIASVHEANIAKGLGIDLIITDHHELQEELPDAYAVINPKYSPEYLFQDLAGVGVAIKLAQHLLGYFPKQFLDLVAIGTIADLVPLINENRVMAFHGLRALSTTKNIGLKALKRVCKIDGDVTEEDVGFSIGPRINAVGRIQDARLAVELLITEDEQEANEIAEMIQEINLERQRMVRTIVKEAEEMVELDDEQSVIFVAKEGWNEGVLGIVASRLVRMYDRPAFVFTMKHETSELKGSARSIPAFNLFANCMKIRDLFSAFGGHSQAAGMTIPMKNIHQIQNKLNECIKQQLSIEDFKQTLEINDTLTISDINENLIHEISQLAPFGMENPKPLFCLKEIPTDMRQIGSNKTHLKLQFRDENELLEGIGFNMGSSYPYIASKSEVSIVGELGINEWNGMRKAQIIMKDLKVEDWQLFDHRGKKQVHIKPYIEKNMTNIIVSNQVSDDRFANIDHVTQIAYDTTLDLIEEADALYIFDLPTDLNQLKEIIYVTKPKSIHACYYVENSLYLKKFPSRDSFKWYYGLIVKRGQLDLNKELTSIIHQKQWTRDKVIFLSKVFMELNFVKIDNGIVKLNPHAENRKLFESRLYQSRLKGVEIEKTLYYSNYDDLKEWFDNCKHSKDLAKEAIINGL